MDSQMDLTVPHSNAIFQEEKKINKEQFFINL